MARKQQPVAPVPQPQKETTGLGPISETDMSVASRLGSLVPTIRRLAIYYMKNIDDAEDLIQDVCYRVLRSAPTHYIEEGKFKHWVMVITKNKALENLRREKRYQRLLSWFDDEIDLSDGLEPMIEFSGDYAIDLDAVEHAILHDLSDEKADVLLCIAAGYEYSETAKVLGVPEGTIKSRAARARAALLEAIA